MHVSWRTPSLTKPQRTEPCIAPGFQPDEDANLEFHGGRILPHLNCIPVFLGEWKATEIRLMASYLEYVMLDPEANEILQQYFEEPVTYEQFSPLRYHFTETPDRFTREDIQHLLEELAPEYLEPDQIDNTAFMLFLPQGMKMTSRGMPREGDAFIGRHESEGHEQVLASDTGLGGYHGSAPIDGKEVLYGISVYADRTDDGRKIGAPYWADPWKNMIAMAYHELQEIRTCPDIELSISYDDDKYLGWYSEKGGEVADFPMQVAGKELGLAMKDIPVDTPFGVKLAPIQLLWSNRVFGPEIPQ